MEGFQTAPVELEWDSCVVYADLHWRLEHQEGIQRLGGTVAW